MIVPTGAMHPIEASIDKVRALMKDEARPAAILLNYCAKVEVETWRNSAASTTSTSNRLMG